MTTPKLPTLRELTAQFREKHAAWTHPDGGGEYVCLAWIDYTEGWHVVPVSDPDLLALTVRGYGREYIPGDECPCAKPRAAGVVLVACDAQCTFDAVAPARRLLAAARDAGFR